MKYYAGLDVSLKETFVSILDESGAVVREASILSDVNSLAIYLKETGFVYERVGIESGQLSIPLCKGLSKKGFLVTCVDARHMAAALSARVNKNDRNDARGIAQMLRAGLYREVQFKSDEACEKKMVLGSRRQLTSCRQQLVGTIRGLLKIYGIKISSQSGFFLKVRQAIQGLSESVIVSIEVLLTSLAGLDSSLKVLDIRLTQMGKKVEDCQRLMTVPGVGIITAMIYKATLDNPERFQNSETVGAYLGLTPKQYASGEIDRHGSISKMGPKECRTMLYEAAQIFLTRVKASSKLKSRGLKLAKRKGMKKAIVAVARKLAVIMHRMLITKEEFKYQ